MDDAVYSCGGQIALARAAGSHVLVITLFGNGSSEPAGHGVFGDIAQRKREEQAAMARLDLDHLWLNYPDLLARPKRARELARHLLPFRELAPSELTARLYAALHALCAGLLAPHGRVHFPLAIGFHPDHRLTFEVGRALSVTTQLSITFYEDVPYAQVAALRSDRLRYLGLTDVEPERPRGLLRDAREIAGFLFAHAPRWQRALGAPFVLGHLALSRALFRLFGRQVVERGTFEAAEREIDEVVHLKVAAMRDYETQTAYFFPKGEAVYEVLSRARGRYVERSWRLGPPRRLPALAGADIYLASEREKLAALLDELRD